MELHNRLDYKRFLRIMYDLFISLFLPISITCQQVLELHFQKKYLIKSIKPNNFEIKNY